MDDAAAEEREPRRKEKAVPRELIAVSPREPVLREYREEPLGPKEVRVRSTMSTVKHGTELRGYRGDTLDQRKPFDWKRRIHVGPPKPPRFPIRLGVMTVGRVVEVGAEVTKFSIGDRVHGHLSIRETHTVAEERLHEVPEGMGDEAVLAWDPACVALGAVRDSKIGVGDRAAVFGLGAIGQMAVQIVRLQGARWVSASDPIACRRDLAESNGADLVIDPIFTDAGLAVRENTGETGVDLALECSGSYGGMNDALRAACYGGTVVSLAYYTGDAAALHLEGEWHRNRLTMLSSRDVSEPMRDHPRWTTKRLHEEAFRLLKEGRLTADGLLRPIVPFEESAEAYGVIDRKPGGTIKLGVVYPS